MTTTASPGYGSHLGYSNTSFASTTNIGQLKMFDGAGGKGNFDDIFNMDSPDINEEVLKTTIKPGELSLEGVYNGGDPTGFTNLLTQLYLSGQAAQGYWKITLSDTHTIQFRAYVSDLSLKVDAKKAITFSAKLMITGGIAFA
jgi:hypothetical protein